MTVKPYLISDIRTGLDRSMEPWLLPADGFPNLEDCYMFRGRIQRRKGFQDLGRLVTSVSGEAVGTVTTPWTSFSGTLAHTDISPGSITITVGALTFTDGGVFGDQTGTLNTSPVTANTGTINYITGAITLTFSPALGGDTAVTAAYEYYTNTPVMGLRTRELSTINKEALIGFNTTKANNFSNTHNKFEDITFYKTTGTAFSWTGADNNFFYTLNYANAFWATNGTRGFRTNPTSNAGSGDGLRWYDGTGWVNFLPPVDGTNYLMGNLMIFSYRNRLVVLNTIEGSAIGTFTNYYQRARWSQLGTPYYDATVPSGFTGGFDASAWRSDVIGKGGFVDAPTSEQIVSAEFYKDTLIVFFERSTWQLRYSGNDLQPFYWERINIELGAESTFSLVPFDAGMVAIGNVGIMSCDATGVKRIDQIIPDEVFEIHNGNDGPTRVYGIRDYFQQLVYWTFPDATNDPTYPNRVLVYNYLDGSYSTFNDSFTCFGYYQPFNDTTWADLKGTWQNFAVSWSSGTLQSDFPMICAGNQQGFVFKNYNNAFISNQPSLRITGATQAAQCTITSSNHNLIDGQIIEITDVQGMTQLNGNVYRATTITSTTFKIQTLDVNNNWIFVDSTAFTAYTAGGRITIRNNINILSKRFNPFLEGGGQLRIQNVDLFLEEASSTEFTMFVYLDENDGNFTEFDVVAPTSPTLGKVWVRTYTSVVGQFVQLEFTFSDAQIVDPDVSDGNFVLHAMMLWMSPAGRLTYGTVV